MKRILFCAAIVLLLSWFLGFFILGAGMFIHVLVIVAAISCMQAVIMNPKRPQITNDTVSIK